MPPRSPTPGWTWLHSTGPEAVEAAGALVDGNLLLTPGAPEVPNGGGTDGATGGDVPEILAGEARGDETTIDAAEAKAGFVRSGQGGEDLRPEIAVSWWRSQLSGVKPEIPVEALTSADILDADERLRRSVQPILDELATNLAGTNSAIVVADHRPVIIDRRGTTRAIEAEMDRLAVLPGYALGEAFVGTNAVGTAAEERRLVRVAGA